MYVYTEYVDSFLCLDRFMCVYTEYVDSFMLGQVHVYLMNVDLFFTSYYPLLSHPLSH